MRTISISDITMKQSPDAGGFSLSFRERLELAKLLDRLGVTVIETGPIVSRRTDSLLVKSLASAIKDSILAVPLTLLDQEDTVELTWNALREARFPRLQVVAPVSTVQMEYLCHKKPGAILERVKELTAAARALCPQVEFVAEDAGRSDKDFLREIVAAAVEAGAGLVTFCDTAGNLLPEEFYEDVLAFRESTPPEVKLGVRISNELALADACAAAAVRAGADEVKTASCGSFTTSLENLTHILKQRGGEYGVCCAVRDTELRRTVGQIRWMCQTNRSKQSPFDNGVREGEGLVLTVHDDLSAVMKVVADLGYELSEEDAVKVYEAFALIASKKERVTEKELDAIVASAALQVPSTYQVERYVINCGDVISATCQILLKKGDTLLEGLSAGDGPVDAAFLAIEGIVGHHYELDDFQIQAVTEGREAMGETVVRLRSATGKVYSGRGISTDVIGAAIRAYVSAVNKIVYEEGNG